MADYPQQANEHEISYDDDPLEYLKFQSDHLRQHLQHTQQQLQQTQQSAFMNEVNHKVNEFMSGADDYTEALDYLTEHRRKELSNNGVSDPVKQDAAINGEAWDIMQETMSKGENPASVAYTMAKEKGYKSLPDRDFVDSLDDTAIDDIFEQMERDNYAETGADTGMRDY